MNHNLFSPNKFEICFLYYINPKKNTKRTKEEQKNKFEIYKFEICNLKNLKE